MISKLYNPKVIQFIQDHLDFNPVEIVMKGNAYPDIPIKEVAEQIDSRRKVVSKLPEWYKTPAVIFPNKQNLEQASSEKTARFKARWVKGENFLDLTGGSGVDTFYLSQQFEKSIYIEPEKGLFDLAKHNFKVLKTSIDCFNSTAEDFLESNSRRFDLVYLDPSRRNRKKERVFSLEEYQPNVLELFDVLVNLGSTLLIKVSPMIDIKNTLTRLPGTSKVQIVAVNNEVKEVLFHIQKGFSGKTKIEAWNLKNESEEKLEFTLEEEIKARASYNEPLSYIYEPNVSIRKAGAFNIVGERYKLKKLHPNTHLYTSNEVIKDFQGKIFEVKRVLKPGRRQVQKAVPNRMANVISKNFAMSATEIKKKYQLKDGGDDYLIFCETVSLGNTCLKCRKL